MKYDEIVRSNEGTKTQIQRVEDIEIPDLWHLATAIENEVGGVAGWKLSQHDADEILEAWHLCHDLLRHIRQICAERDAGISASTAESRAA